MDAMGDRSSLLVSEIFQSIQGESSWTGLPCVFVRLAGCPLRCRWCDTVRARHGGSEICLEAVLARVEAYRCALVEVTGGEPLAQRGALDLMRRLADLGHTVLLETSGAFPIDDVDLRVHRIVDAKCPGSGEVRANLTANWARLRTSDELKFVVADRVDYEWARGMIREHGLESRTRLLMSPVAAELAPARLAAWILEDHLDVRLQLQLHKIIWPAGERGV